MAKVRLADIAQRCNVTAATVSRILNRVEGAGFSVRPEVRERVLRVAGEMRYRSHFAGRALATRRTGLVFVLGLHSNQFQTASVYEDMLAGVQEHLLRRGYGLYAGLRHPEQPAIRPPLGLFDGVLLIHSTSFLKAEEAILSDMGLPYVGLNCQVGAPGGSVMADDAAGVRLAMEHLLGLGHRRIAYCPGLDALRKDSHPSRVLRRDAFAECLARAGLAPAADPERVWGSMEEYMRETVLAEGATAVLAYDARVARELIFAARQARVAIPERLSVVCFNDVLHGAAFAPEVTAVALPSREMGELAARCLLGMIDREFDDVDAPADETLHYLMPVRLAARQTTAPPPVEPKPAQTLYATSPATL